MNKYGYKLIPMGYSRFANDHQYVVYTYEIYQFLDMKWRLIYTSDYEDSKINCESDAKCWIQDKRNEDNNGIVKYP